MKRSTLRGKFLRAFTLQIIMISVVTVLGIFMTAQIVEDLLTRQALQHEAEHFWGLYEADPSVALPDTANMTGYLGAVADPAGVPEALRPLTPGYGRHPLDGATPLIYVEDRAGLRLYLVFAEEQVSDLVLYFGLIPLAIVLLCIYVLAFLSYRSAQQAISPVIRLANYLEDFDLKQNNNVTLDLEALRDDPDSEVSAMIDAVDHFASRLEHAIAREREFTRDAGHELRTPVAVFKGSLDLLEQTPERPESERQALARMRKAINEMQALLETLLLLAREDELSASVEDVAITDVIRGQLELLREQAERKDVRLELVEEAPCIVRAPRKVLEILLGNLLRNAVNYTEHGRVRALVDDGVVQVEDTGVGMGPEDLDKIFEAFYRGDKSRHVAPGHGLGLAIVKRLAERYRWQIGAVSALGEGTRFEVRFNGG